MDDVISKMKNDLYNKSKFLFPISKQPFTKCRIKLINHFKNDSERENVSRYVKFITVKVFNLLKNDDDDVCIK